jgi:phosphatidylserine/phosphatidylglycerophosphate/cardiolipin synthase-like enzyme
MRTIQIGKSGVLYSALAEDLDALRAQFDRQHYLRFDDLLGPELLDFVQLQIDRSEFYERVHEGIGSNKELCMTSNTAFAALQFLINDQRLFQLIQDVTQCDQIGCFQGRVYRINPGSGHHDSWHNDIGEHRLVGMSINLSRELYSGGRLQIRDHVSGEIVSEAANAGIGDAIIFRLSDRFQHRITEVEGTASKTAFAGWFRAQPDFMSLLRKQSQPGREPAAMKCSSLVSGAKDRSRLNMIY